MLGAEKLQETMETVVESCKSQCIHQGRAVHVEKVYTLEHAWLYIRWEMLQTRMLQ
jgi:hypothetical protein